MPKEHRCWLLEREFWKAVHVKIGKGCREVHGALTVMAAEASGGVWRCLGLVGDGGLLAFDTQGPRMLNTVQYPPQSHTAKYRFTPKVSLADEHKFTFNPSFDRWRN